MKKIVTRAAETALAAGVAGGVLVIGTSVAGAQEAPTTTAEGDGVLAGNAVNADLDAPVTLCGIAGSLLGVATDTCETPPAPPPSQDTTAAQATGAGVGAGNAVGLDADVPITICGVGVVGGGVATGVCEVAPSPMPVGALAAAQTPPGGGDTTVAHASGNGVLTGNALGIDIDAPITVCGVGGALLGVATGTCALPPPPHGAPGTGGHTTVATASGDGLLAGNALGLDIGLPISICGIGVAVGGVATGDCTMAPAPAPALAPSGGLRTATDSRATSAPAASKALAATGPDPSATASGDGLLAGNAIASDLDALIAACGAGVVGLGVGTGACQMDGPPPPPPLFAPPRPSDRTVRDGVPPEHWVSTERYDDVPFEHWDSVNVGRLPHTGAATDVALPLGLGLIGTGMAFKAAGRRWVRRLAAVR